MEIKLEDLWEELEFEESLKDYVIGKVDSYIEQIKEQVNEAIKTRIKHAIESINNELAMSNGFAKCADMKINKHLLSHSELPEELIEEFHGEENND